MISLNLLRSMVPWKLTNQEIIDGFIRLGIEVEEVTNRNNIEGTRIGIIREISPVTEKLNLTKTEVEKGRILDIVTNSKTVKVGDKIIAASPGGRIGDLKVTERKLQGTLSQGVFLGAKECGIPLELLPADERDGVWILPEDAPEFTDPAESLWLKDTILDESITPNHPEWQGLEGIIRELGIVWWWKSGEAPKIPRLETPKIPFVGDSSESMKLEIDTESGCQIYTGVFADIPQVKPSGFEMRKKLLASNIRAINNIVDATNLAMYFTNQPTHAFDADKLKTRVIKVSQTTSKTKFKTLDEVEHDLPVGTLMIRDGDKPVAIAGIMGGLDTEVDTNTKRIFLESACFDYMQIAETVSKTGIRTDASARFDKGSDFETTERTAMIVMDFLGINCAKPMTVGRDTKRSKVALRSTRMKQILGYLPKIDQVKTGFSLLGLNCEGDADITVEIPGYRMVDISAEIDLIEEAVRVTGYDQVPSTLPSVKLSMMNELPEFGFERRLRRIVAGSGLNECVTMTFTCEKELTKMNLLTKLDDAPKISNPMTADATMLRPISEIGLILTAARNIRQGNNDLKLFEIGSQFGPETRRLSLLLFGSSGISWDRETKKYDFYDIKGLIQSILNQLNVAKYKIEASAHPNLHPYRQVNITIDGNIVGYFGELHPDVCDEYDIPGRVQVGNIDIEKLRKSVPSIVEVKPIPKYPAILRDISILSPNSITCSEIEEIISKSCDERLSKINLFDQFISDEFREKNIRSLAFSLIFSDLSGTMKGEEIDKQIETITKNLEQIGAKVRD